MIIEPRQIAQNAWDDRHGNVLCGEAKASTSPIENGLSVQEKALVNLHERIDALQRRLLPISGPGPVAPNPCLEAFNPAPACASSDAPKVSPMQRALATNTDVIRAAAGRIDALLGILEI